MYECGVKRINVSIDTLNPSLFSSLTRRGDLAKVLQGVEEAKKVGLKIKINSVALKGVNDDELADMIRWCGREGFDMTIIEVMPMGDIGTERRLDQYLPLSLDRSNLARKFDLIDIPERTSGPARYVKVSQTGGKLGFITPLSHNFCESCNRVRMTCTGELFMCLGQNDNADLRTILREEGEEALRKAINKAIDRKPKGHDFIIDRRSGIKSVERHMNVTGG